MINNVVLTGRLTKDPELKNLKQIKLTAVEFTLAVDRPSKNGNKTADFIPVITFDKVAENVTNYCKKGSLVGVEGSLRIDTWQDKDKAWHTRAYIISNKITFLQTKENSEKGNDLPF